MAGCTAAEAIHVGDSISTDVKGAHNAGLRASVWIDVKVNGLGFRV